MRMILSLRRSARCLGVLALAALVGAGCTRGGSDGEGGAEAARVPAGELLGLLKLVRQEYPNAVVPGGGTVADPTEYAETELFAEQAQGRLSGLAKIPSVSRESLSTLGGALDRVQKGVAAKAPTAEVLAATTEAIGVVETLLAGATPEAIRGIVLATSRADQAIGAEAVLGEYRVGVVSGPARSLFLRRDGALVAAPAPKPGEVYLGVVLRERRTKRTLPAATVTVSVAGAEASVEAPLVELWGDFHQYGANVALPPDGPVTVTVHVSPPAYARHGDMLTVFVTPVTATLAGHVRDGVLTFDAKPVTPVDPDYAVGDDVLQAEAEARTLRDAGPYRVGLIVEGPEPVWPWTDGAPHLQTNDPASTNHVEVVLLDRETGLLVPNAHVMLTFLAGNEPVGTAMLHPLLSIFAHYGQTLALPPGTTAVRAEIGAPALGALDRPRLADAVTVELPLPAKEG